MRVFSVDEDSLTSWITALVVVIGFVVLKSSVLPRLRWWKDLQVIVGWVRLLPHFYRLRDVTGPVLWSEAVRKYHENPFIWSLTYSQVDDWCSELQREVFSDVEPARPFGVFVDDAKLGVIIMVTGLKLGVPLVLYHLAAVGDLLQHQISQVPEVKYMLVSARRIPQIQDAEPGWIVRNNLWDKSLRFRSLCVIERAEDQLDELGDVSEEGDTEDEGLQNEVTEQIIETEQIIDVETVEEVVDNNEADSKSIEQDDPSCQETDFRQTYDNVFVVLFTSGTTGFSKGTLVKATKFALMGPRMAQELGVTSRDVIMTISPVTRLIWQIAAALTTGCAIQPNNGVAEVPANIKATVLHTAYQTACDLVDSIEAKRHSIPKVRLWMALGFPGDTADRIRNQYPKLTLMNYYGSTEGVVGLFSRDNVLACGYRTKHFLNPLVQLLELDESESPIRDPDTGLCVLGNRGLLVKRRIKYFQINRYVGIAEETNQIRDVVVLGDVYECTGDIMRDDGKGKLYFVKRVGDNFRYKNQNCSCEHVERLLHQIAAVRSCAVYAVLHPDHHNRVGMAALQLHGHVTTSTRSLFISLYHHLDKNHGVKPLFIRMVKEFSYLETCKIDKMRLRREGFKVEGVYVCDDEKRTYLPFTCPLRLLAEHGE